MRLAFKERLLFPEGNTYPIKRFPQDFMFELTKHEYNSVNISIMRAFV